MQKQKSVEALKTGRMKLPEKAVPESHREYLDMDTDEEEFGCQDTPEPQDEAPSEPDRPEFTVEELNILVQQTKELAVLPGLSESSWTESCLERIRQYYCDPSKLVLTIYFSDNELQALLDFPDDTDSGLTYILRTLGQVYRPHDFITFGSLGARVESSIFKFVDVLYAPLAFNNKWPDIIEDKVFSNINDFLTRAMDVTYKPTGMLLLYVPWEGTRIKPAKQSLEIESAVRIKYQSEQRLLNNRLEKVTRNWIKQIREALIIIPTRTDQLYDVKSEFEFWKNRYENLACISAQLKSERLLLITDQLKRVQSATVDDLKRLVLKVGNALNDAKSNIIYLDVLVENCEAFKEPSEARDHLPKILNIVRFIWSELPYYNESENVERLLRALSVCIIKVCVNSVDLKLMLDHLEKCEETIQLALACLRFYSQIYDDIIRNITANADNWRVNKVSVFNYIKAFGQRCLDLSEICDAIKIYGSSKKVNFGGPRGSYREIQYRRLQDYFSEIMNEMEISFNYALDITEIKWFQDMSNFRYELDELDNTMTNLLNSLFEDVVSVEMGIETLYTLFQFKDRRKFNDILSKKWTQVWKMFFEEIKLRSEESVEHEIVQDEAKLLQSEQSIISIVNEKYLKQLYERMINASDWLGDCDLQFEPLLLNFIRKMSD